MLLSSFYIDPLHVTRKRTGHMTRRKIKIILRIEILFQQSREGSATKMQSPLQRPLNCTSIVSTVGSSSIPGYTMLPLLQ